jgi:hypothetical protein
MDDVVTDGARLNETIVRFKLVIDGTADDSGLRLLQYLGVLPLAKLSVLDLTQYPQASEDDAAIARSQVVANVRMAMANGTPTALMYASAIHGSLYDVLNQVRRLLYGTWPGLLHGQAGREWFICVGAVVLAHVK